MPPESCARALRRLCLVPGLCILGAAVAIGNTAPAQSAERENADTWYRVELLVFRQPGDAGLAAEAWQPEPELTYPAGYRFLIDRDLADLRRRAFRGSHSRFDKRGRQQLSLPEPRHADSPELSTLKSDRVQAPPFGRDIPRPGEASVLPDTALEAPAGDDVSAEPGALPIEPGRPDASLDTGDAGTPLPAPAPYTLTPTKLRELNRDASRLQSSGYGILFHESWVQPVADEAAANAIILDRSGDPDVDTWPELQGSITLHLSRYLHVTTQLWLNTDGDYLHPHWRMPEPPRSPPSLVVTLPSLDAWYARHDEGMRAPEVTRPDARLAPPEPAPPAGATATAATKDADESAETDYPWRHAIPLQQSRRMRGGELHYLDHPVLGVLIKLTQLDAESWRETYRAMQNWQWEDRHSVIRQTQAFSPAADSRR